MIDANTGHFLQMFDINSNQFQFNGKFVWSNTHIYDVTTFKPQYRLYPKCKQAIDSYLFVENVAYVESFCGGIIALQTSNREMVWHYQIDDNVIQPFVIYQNSLYFWTKNGEIHELDPENGLLLGKLTTNGDINTTQAGLFAGNNILVAVVDAHKIWGFVDNQ